MSVSNILNYDGKIYRRYLPEGKTVGELELGQFYVKKEDPPLVGDTSLTFDGTTGGADEPPNPTSGIIKTDGVTSDNFGGPCSEFLIKTAGVYEFSFSAALSSVTDTGLYGCFLAISNATKTETGVAYSTIYTSCQLNEGGSFGGSVILGMDADTYVIVVFNGPTPSAATLGSDLKFTIKQLK